MKIVLEKKKKPMETEGLDAESFKAALHNMAAEDVEEPPLLPPQAPRPAVPQTDTLLKKRLEHLEKEYLNVFDANNMNAAGVKNIELALLFGLYCEVRALREELSDLKVE